MLQVEALWQAPGQRVIILERDCSGLLGRTQGGGKGTKKDRNGVDGLLSQPRQNFLGCLQCSCPGSGKAVLGVGMAKGAITFKLLAMTWACAVEANTCSSASSLEHHACCCLEGLRGCRHGWAPLLPRSTAPSSSPSGRSSSWTLCCALSWALPSPWDTLGNSSVSESGAFPRGQRSTVAEIGGKQTSIATELHCPPKYFMGIRKEK